MDECFFDRFYAKYRYSKQVCAKFPPCNNFFSDRWCLMNVICLDLEGVLFPEIWIALAEQTGLEELRLTTRDIADYRELMNHRIAVLDREHINLSDIQKLIGELSPLPGAVDFLDTLRGRRQVFIVSDTFYEFLPPVSACLNRPTVICNTLVTNNDRIVDFSLRQEHGKLRVVEALQGLNFRVAAAGDSHNDLEMLNGADSGALFRAPQSIVEQHSHLPAFTTYDELDAWERNLD